MGRMKALGAITFAVAFSGGAAAWADVTAEDVWQDWTSYYAELGQTVSTGSQGMQGDTLVITDAVFTSNVEGGSFTAAIADLKLREMGDGRVEVTLSNEMPMRIFSKPATGEALDAALRFTQSGLSMIVSGNPGEMSYAIAAPQMGFVVDSLIVDDKPVPLKLDIALTGNSGTYSMKKDGGRDVTSQFSADAATFDIAASDPEGTGSLTASGRFDALTAESRAFLPETVNMADMNAALQAGFRADGRFGYGGGHYQTAFKDGAETIDATSSGEGGEVRFAMSKDGLSYGGEGRASQLAMTVSSLPVPIEASIARSAFNMVLPVSKSEVAAPFAAMISLVDVKVSDGLWNLFDPGVQLPRDPATLTIDLSGMAQMLIDIMDPATATGDQAPGKLESLSLNQLQVTAAGAELTGQGAATFDNSGPVPKPVGAVDLTLVGGNGLIDKLVAMGLLPEEQAMGARMMLGLFAVVSGEDTLTSKIEFREDGGIYANGQRLQ